MRSKHELESTRPIVDFLSMEVANDILAAFSHYFCEVFSLLPFKTDRGKLAWLKKQNLDKNLFSRLFIAASGEGELELFKLLIKHPDVNPAYGDNEAFILASERGYISVVKLLLKDLRVDPTARNHDAIIRSCADGQIEVVKLLLRDARVDPSTNENFVICKAFECYQNSNDNKERVNYLDLILLLHSFPKVSQLLNNEMREAIKAIKLELYKKYKDKTAKYLYFFKPPVEDSTTFYAQNQKKLSHQDLVQDLRNLVTLKSTQLEQKELCLSDESLTAILKR